MSDLIKCPKCSSTQITANKKGFSAGKAAAGLFLAGGVGLLAGAIGSGKVKVTCLSCGNEWEAGKPQKQIDPEELKKPVPVLTWISLLIMLGVIIYMVVMIADRWK